MTAAEAESFNLKDVKRPPASSMFIFCSYYGAMRVMVRRGERPPKGNSWKQATIGNDAYQGNAFNLSCEVCRHFVQYAASDVMVHHRIPRDTPGHTLVQRLKCGACGSRKVCLMMSPMNAQGHGRVR